MKRLHMSLFMIFCLVILVAGVARFYGPVDSSIILFESEDDSQFDVIDPSVVSEKVVSINEENGEEELSSYMYGEFPFVQMDELWWTAVNMQERNEILQIPLHYGALDVAEITFSGRLDESFDSTDDVYIAINPDVANKYYTVALSEMNFNLVKGIRRRPVAACTSMAEGCEDREILSCENNPDGLPVIEYVLLEGSDNEELASGEMQDAGSVEFDGNCVTISGVDEEILKASDALIMLWYGII